MDLFECQDCYTFSVRDSHGQMIVEYGDQDKKCGRAVRVLISPARGWLFTGLGVALLQVSYRFSRHHIHALYSAGDHGPVLRLKSGVKPHNLVRFHHSFLHSLALAQPRIHKASEGFVTGQNHPV